MTDSVPNPTAFSRYPLSYKRTARFIVALILAFFVGVCAFGIWVAFCPELPLGARILGGMLAVGIASLFARAGWLAIRRRLKTGQWAITEEERREVARRGVKPIWMGLMPARFRNNPKDPAGLKFIAFCLWTPVGCAAVATAILHRAHGLNVPSLLLGGGLTLYGAWDFLRALPRPSRT